MTLAVVYTDECNEPCNKDHFFIVHRREEEGRTNQECFALKYESYKTHVHHII